MAGFVLLAAFYVAILVGSIRSGNERGLIAAVAAAPFVVVVAYLVVLAPFRGRTGVGRARISLTTVPETGGRAVVLPYGLLSFVLIPLVALSCLPLFGLFATWGWTSLVARGIDDVRPPLLVGTAVSSLIVVAAARSLVRTLTNTSRWRRFVALGPDGIHHCVEAFEVSIPWRDIAEVRAATMPLHVHVVQLELPAGGTPYQLRATRSAQRQIDKDPTLLTRLPSRALTVDPALLYHAVRFYHQNPDLRAELGDEAGLDRIRRADFPGLVDAP